MTQAIPHAVDAQQALTWLKGGEYAPLDAALNALQRAFEAREQDEDALVQAMAPFYNFQPRLQGRFKAWVEQYPQSYAAHLAMGMQLSGKAWWYRTYRRAVDVPSSNWPLVAQACEEASAHLHDAMRCTREPSLAAARRLNLNRIFSEDTWDGYLEAVERCPTSVQLRQAQIDALRPEWGGSIEAMNAFLKRPEQEGLTHEQRERLRATVLACEGHYLEHFEENATDARQKFQASLDAQETTRGLTGLASVVGAQETEVAERSLLRALELAPYDQDIRAKLAMEYLQQYRFRRTMRLLHAARAGGSPLANDTLKSMPIWAKAILYVLALVR